MRPLYLSFGVMMLALGAAGAGQVPAPGAASSDVLPFAATERTLANGLRVIVVPTGFPDIVSIQIPVQTGSRNEVEPGKSGFAHFFEHVMFRGTPKNPPERRTAIMTMAGARDNATTGDDATRYYATFAKEDLDTVMALYADMFQNLSYPEADFKTEARAVLGEYNKNSANPIAKLFEVQREHAFTTHTYRHTTMGFVQDIENMPTEYEYSKLFFERWYRPQYTTVVVAGDVTPEEVMPMIERHWGGWRVGTTRPAEIPKEPEPAGAQYVHVPWQSDTLPLVTVAFRGPAFSAGSRDTAAMDLIAALYFGETSELYKRLVVREQKVDALDVDVPTNVDPSLFTVLARVKQPGDAVYVRDAILAAIAAAKKTPVEPARLADAQSFRRYAFARTLDSTERIATVVARFAAYDRSYDTVNAYYRTLAAVTPADVQQAASRYFTDNSLIVTTLSKDSLPAGIDKLPALGSIQPATAGAEPSTPVLQAADAARATNGGGSIPLVQQKSPLPQLNVKVQFLAGSARDPAGKEGLAALTASMIAEAGSKALTIDQIQAALYPIAGSFTAQADKEMTTFTGVIHRDNWQRFLAIVLPQLVEPGFRQEDFTRLKDAQMNALVQDLRANNEEELGKERLQTDIFQDTPYGHVTLGTVAGLQAITLEDVKTFARQVYTRANAVLGVNGAAPDEMLQTLQAQLATLPAGAAMPRVSVKTSPRAGTFVDIIRKDTRATAISLGFPIAVTRAHPDFAALSVARAWLGEHRASSGRLFKRIREVRGMNYGDYAYIEAFPGGMFQFFPDPNIARQAQIFEIWIRPVVPANAHMALRIAKYELDRLVENGLTGEQFEMTRTYLMKNVAVMTARQDQQLGYALDSRWYGIGDFTDHMRQQLRALTLEKVNAAIRTHLASNDLTVVCITQDADTLQDALVSDAFSPIKYDGQKPQALLDEDRIVGALKLGIPAGHVTITPVTEVFAR
jgi:zinc protease